MTLKEREHMADVLTKTQWDTEKAAHLLQISVFGLKQKLKEYGLEHPEPGQIPNAEEETPEEKPVPNG